MSEEITVTYCRRHDRLEARADDGRLLGALEAAWDNRRDGYSDYWLRGIADCYRVMSVFRGEEVVSTSLQERPKPLPGQPA